MNQITDVLLKSYNEQVRKTFIPAGVRNPEEWEVKLNKELADVNEAQLLYIEGGLFANCCLERPVMNLTINPRRALANRIPVVLRNTQISTYAYLSNISGATGDLPVAPCDDSPEVGDLSACYLNLVRGRISFQSKTMEIDAIIERMCRGIHTDLYMIGSVRGVSGPVPSGSLENESLIAQGAVRRQIQLIGREMQNELLRQFWNGNADNPAVNTANGGAKQFWGLNYLIADDYGTEEKAGIVTGTNCANLNSDVKTFDACIGTANEDTGAGIYAYMQELEDTLYNRAALMGYSNVEWVWVMHPILWSSLVKYLPCEIMSDSCNTPSGATAAQVMVVSNDLGQVALRQEMNATMRVSVNGRSYQVIVDDSLPLTITPPSEENPATSHEGTIYFVPLRVDGEAVLFWDSKDYRTFASELSPIPGGLATALRGWTDGGTRLLTVESNRSCFLVWSKIEMGLVFLAPHLAGRIDGVSSCNLQAKNYWNGTVVEPEEPEEPEQG